MDQNEVRQFARRNCTDSVRFPQPTCAVRAVDPNRFNRSKASLHEQFKLALVTESR